MRSFVYFKPIKPMQTTREMGRLLDLEKASKLPVNPITAGNEDATIFQSILGDLKEALVGKIKEKATGWIMNLVGMGPGPDPLDTIKDQLEKQYEELKVIESKIDALGVALDEAVEVIKAEIDGDKYYTAIQVLNISASNITAAFERLQFSAGLAPGPERKNDMAEQALYIRTNIPNAFIAIKNSLTGTGSGGENIISLGTRIAFKAAKSLPEYGEMIHTQFMYYYGLQLKAVMLIVEAYHFDGSPGMAKQYFNSYVGQMNEEINMYLKYAPKCSLKNTLPIAAGPSGIVSKGNKFYVQAGTNDDSACSLITIRNTDAQIINTLEIPDTRLQWRMIEKDGMAYLASMARSDSSRWDITKVGLGDAPTVLGRLSYGPPGPGPFRMAFVTGFDIDGDYLYVMFLNLGVPGFVIKVIDLKTFKYANDKEINIGDDIQGAGSISGNGLKVKDGKLYLPAWFSSDGFHSIKVIDAKAKAIVQTLKIEPMNGNAGRSPMLIRDDLLYCTGDDTELRVVDLSKPQITLAEQTHVKAYMQELLVDGYLVYFSSVGFQDPRGELCVVYWSPKSSVMVRSMKIGSGVAALNMDNTRIYAGAGGGDKFVYILSYAHDITGNIIPIEKPPGKPLPV